MNEWIIVEACIGNVRHRISVEGNLSFRGGFRKAVTTAADSVERKIYRAANVRPRS